MSTIHIDAAGEAAAFHEIIQSVSLTHLLVQRDAVLERINQAFSLIQEAHDIAKSGKLGFPILSVAKEYRGNGESIAGEFAREGEAMRICQEAVDTAAWRYLMQESGMRSLMSASKRKEFDNQLGTPQMPVLTREAIYATFCALHEARADMFDQGVVECFKQLSWRYKTNLPQKLGSRIIVSHLGDTYGLNHRATDQLDDLMRVFHVLDGKPEADSRYGCYMHLAQAFREQCTWPKAFENDYFSLKLFRNRNGHLCFKRRDLIDAMNGIIARHFPGALPAPR